MHKNMIKIYSLIFALVLVASCSSTQKVWSTFKPSEYVYVMTDGKDPEPILKENNIDYYCEKVAYTSDKLNKACYVEKTLAQKTNEFTRSLTNTPKAMAKDILVIGKVTIQAIAVVLQGSTSF